jgi:hypothetical protein
MNSTPENVICLYSKFSNSSQSFVKSSQDLPIQFVCIDNKKVRTRVMSDPNLQITFVPCILSLFPDGRLEKYEGKDAFNWLDNIKQEMQSNTQNNEKMTQATLSKQPLTQQPTQPPTQSVTPSTNKSVETKYDPDSESVYSQHDFHSQQMKEKHSKITDLDFEADNESETSKVSSGMKNSINDKEKLMTKSLNKISTKNTGKKDIMAAAREMEKMREQDESKKPRPLNMPKI